MSEAAAAPAQPARTSLASLLTRHILRDGELILLILRPSAWYVLLVSVRLIVAVGVLMGIGIVLDRPHASRYIETAVVIVAGRIMLGVLQWMGRLYVLTDMRIIRIAGIFNVDIFDCPLRKVSRTQVIRPWRERALGLGSIEILPRDEHCLTGVWQTIRRPIQVNETIVAAINRARHCGLGADAA